MAPWHACNYNWVLLSHFIMLQVVNNAFLNGNNLCTNALNISHKPLVKMTFGLLCCEKSLWLVSH